MVLRGRGKAGDPKSPEVAFLLAAADESVLARVQKRFFGGAKMGFSAPLKALCQFEYIFSALAGSNAAFDSSHRIMTSHSRDPSRYRRSRGGKRESRSSLSRG